MQNRTIYIRYRGQTTGPFSDAEVKLMVERGQISRLHALSTDRIQWHRAGTLSKLYVDNDPTASLDTDTFFLDGSDSDAGNIESDAAWYYALDGREVGPVTGEQLQRLIERDALGKNDLVWCQGMANWLPVQETDMSAHLMH